MKGRVWVASYFFANCPSICKQQNSEIAKLAEKLKDLDLNFVSITSDAANDTPDQLNSYAQQFGVPYEKWRFLSGEQLHVERIGEERFQVAVRGESHSTKLLLIDKWGEVRGKFSWSSESEMKEFRLLVDTLIDEKSPPKKELGESKPSEGSSDSEDN